MTKPANVGARLPPGDLGVERASSAGGMADCPVSLWQQAWFVGSALKIARATRSHGIAGATPNTPGGRRAPTVYKEIDPSVLRRWSFVLRRLQSLLTKIRYR